MVIKRFDQVCSGKDAPERTSHRLKARLPLFSVKIPLPAALLNGFQ